VYINPYQNLENGSWYKTNFHTHAGTGPNTCGANPIERVAELYSQAGFGMLCISNHDLFTDTSGFSTQNLLMVPGVEYSKSPHMLTIGVKRSLHDFDHQGAIDETCADGGFAILCHPNWTMQKHWHIGDILKMRGYAGIELVNMLIYRLDGSGLAADVWDALLSAGKLVFGFGSDDFHAMIDCGRGFNYICCAERSVEGMIQAVKAGRFCASTGLMPEYLVVEGGKIRVRAKYPTQTFIDSFSYRFIGENGRLLAERHGGEAQYEPRGEKYIRVEAAGENGALLFFQPVWLEGALSPA